MIELRFTCPETGFEFAVVDGEGMIRPPYEMPETDLGVKVAAADTIRAQANYIKFLREIILGSGDQAN